MIITVINSPRSGSHSLFYWFRSKNIFKMYILPLHPDEKPKVIKIPENTEGHYCFNNDFYIEDPNFKSNDLYIYCSFFSNNDYSEIINKSDKVIFLYRENEKEQIESWIMARRNKVYSNNTYTYEKVDDELSKIEEDAIKKLNLDFSERYLNNPENFCISYEELFYKNGIKRIIEYLNIPDIDTSDFPYGKKYRQD